MAEFHSPFFDDLDKDDGLESPEEVQDDSEMAHKHIGRRDSQVGSSYGDNEPHSSTAIFDGPASFNYPNSVSSMYHERHVRTGRAGSRQSSRRASRDLGIRGTDSPLLGRRLSFASQALSDEEEALDTSRYPARPDSQRSSSPPARGTGSVFENIASFFGRGGAEEEIADAGPLSRRSSRRGSRSSLLSRRSSEHSYRSGATQDGWGFTYGEDEFPPPPAASNLEEQESMSGFSSRPPSRSGDFPFISRDPLFGDVNQHFQGLSEEDIALSIPPGPPSRQRIFLTDEDVTVQFVGYEVIPWRLWGWRFGCCLSAGSLALIGNWFPRLWMTCTMHERPFSDIRKGYIVVEV
jgi:cation-transporting ATPase 13A2